MSQYVDGTQSWVEFGETVKTGDPEVVNAGLDGEPLFLSGSLTTDQFIKDDKFGVSYKGLSLKRDAEIYQWFEEVQTSTYRGNVKTGPKAKGAATTRSVSYYTKWTFHPVDHNDFENPAGHENTPILPREKNVKLQADYYEMGAHKIPGSLFGQISWDSAKLVALNTKLALPPNYIAEFSEQGLYLYPNEQTRESPQIGDVRYIYTTSNRDQVSLIGGQSGNRVAFDESSIRSAILAGKYSSDELVAHQTDSLKESSNEAIYISILLVFISMFIFDRVLKDRLHSAPIWNLFINQKPIVSAVINTVWCYAILYAISLYYFDFSQVLFIILEVFLGFAVFFMACILIFGKRREA